MSEVARALRVCSATVFKLCARGQLEHVRVLNSVRVHPESLAVFLATRDKG